MASYDFGTCKHPTKASPNSEIGRYRNATFDRFVWSILNQPATMLHYSHTADHRVRSYTDRSMPERNLVGDLLRLHPSPEPVGSRSIDNKPGTVFPSTSLSPSTASMSDTCSPLFAGDAAVWSRRRAGSRFDRSIDRRITKPCPSSALCGHVCAPRRGGSQRGGGHFGDSADT